MLTPKKIEFIEFMMSAEVLRFGDFITKSGRRTPYFINTGNYKTGAQIATLGKYYAALVQETVGDNFTAMFACSRSDIHDIICCKHGVLIVFHDNKRISEVSQMLERSEQLVIVSLVESDARLIQNICHADQTGADLGGKPDTLRLAA